MTGRSLLGESLAREESLKQALERALALADAWDLSASSNVRRMAASLRAVIAQPQEAK